MRAVVLLPQVLKPRSTTRQQVTEGIHLIVWGLFKKAFIADGLAPIVDATFSAANPSGFEVLIGVYAFAFQIYCDFSGYTDIARGVAKLFGFELGLNFNLPYFAQNPQDFWSRWHISLSTWLRNYLYIPLGGNRNGSLQTYRNLMLTMLLGGLWHGAAWNFVLWGAYQGAMLAIHRLWTNFFPSSKPVVENDTSPRSWLKMAVMFQFTCYGWLLFRAESLEQIAQMTAALARPFDTFDWAAVMKLVPFIVPLVAVQVYQYVTRNHYFLSSPYVPLQLRTACYAALCYMVVFGAAAPQAFIYFQF
jgi:alginate O-acetyltransferase complex protein AlgI